MTLNEMTEFVVDIWDLDISDEEIAVILSEMGDDLEAGTWEGLDLGSPW